MIMKVVFSYPRTVNFYWNIISLDDAGRFDLIIYCIKPLQFIYFPKLLLRGNSTHAYKIKALKLLLVTFYVEYSMKRNGPNRR